MTPDLLTRAADMIERLAADQPDGFVGCCECDGRYVIDEYVHTDDCPADALVAELRDAAAPPPGLRAESRQRLTCWLVYAECGSYSDYRYEPVAVRFDEASARKIAEDPHGFGVALGDEAYGSGPWEYDVEEVPMPPVEMPLPRDGR
jgi:hypothetical protein